MNPTEMRRALMGHEPEVVITHQGPTRIRCTCGGSQDIWGFADHLLDVLHDAQLTANTDAVDPELSPRERYLQTLESMHPDPVLQRRIDEVRAAALAARGLGDRHFDDCDCGACSGGGAKTPSAPTAQATPIPDVTLDQLQVLAARAVHVHPDLNRRERADALSAILGEPDASFERIARFIMWADAYQERAVEIATETSYSACILPPPECDGCLCPTEHDGDYGSAGHAGPCPPHTCPLPPGSGDPQ